MKMETKIAKGIEQVLKSGMSTTDIAKLANVNASNISRLRTGFASIDNIKFSTAMALYELSLKTKITGGVSHETDTD